MIRPFFEVGTKNLLRLPEILDVAVAAQRAGERSDVAVIMTVPTALVTRVRTEAPAIAVFAQNMDTAEPGSTVGRVTAESLVDAGAHGVMLNHASLPLDSRQLRRSVIRAQVNGLLTMVCAGQEREVIELLPLRPTIILFEPPELIGHRGGADRPWIEPVNQVVSDVAPDVLMMHAGGVGTPDDAYQIMRSGADGTGSTSGVLQDRSPSHAVAQFIDAVRRGFDHHQAEGIQ